MGAQVRRLHDASRKQQLRAQLLINDLLMLSSPAIKHKADTVHAQRACPTREEGRAGDDVRCRDLMMHSSRPSAWC
jgi:hypothetical protein